MLSKELNSQSNNLTAMGVESKDVNGTPYPGDWDGAKGEQFTSDALKRVII